MAILVVVAGCSVGMTAGAIGGGANSNGANVGDTGNADAMVSWAMARNPNYAGDYAQVTFKANYLITATFVQVTVIDLDQSGGQIGT